MRKIEKLKNEWLPQIMRGNPNLDEYVEVTEDDGESDTKTYEQRYRFRLYTSKYVYTIRAIDRSENDGYLACGVSTRKSRAGEDWIRGSDLPDGPFTEETWNSIKHAIIGYELRKLALKAEPIAETIGPPVEGEDKE